MRIMKITIKQSSMTRKITILLLLCCIQNISIITFGNAGLKLGHLYALIFLPLFFRCSKIEFPNKKVWIFFIYIIFNAIINYYQFPINSLLLNYIFGIYIMFIITNFSKKITMQEWKNIFQTVAVIMIVMVWIKNIFEIHSIITFFKNPWGHPNVSTIFGGGVNLEATWLAMFGFSFEKDKKGWLYNLSSFGVSIVYASRAGCIVNIMWLLWILCNYFNKKQLMKLLAGIGITGVVLGIFYHMGIMDYIIHRFANIGSEKGSMGRTEIWKYVKEVIKRYPLGCGIGNNMLAIERISGKEFLEENVHNLYFQMFIDLGWIGGIAYLGMIIMFIIKKFSNLLKNPFVAMLYVYIILALLQFRGGEPLIFFILSVYFLNEHREEQENEEQYDFDNSAGI